MNSKAFSQMILSGLAVILAYTMHYGSIESIQSGKASFDSKLYYINYILLLFGYLGFVYASKSRDPILLVSVAVIYATTVYMMQQDVEYLQGKKPELYKVSASPEVVFHILGWIGLLYVCFRKAKYTALSVLMIPVLLYTLPLCREYKIVDNPSYSILTLGWVLMALALS